MSEGGGVYLGTFFEGGFIAAIEDVKINDRFFLNGDRLRGFKNLGVGPRDTSTGDALGGEIYYLVRNELNFPLGLPDDLGVTGLAFIDVGSIYNTNSSSSLVKDENKLRASAGVGLTWISPFGPVKFFLSRAILKENYDKKEILDLVLVQHIKYKIRSNMKRYIILFGFIFLSINLNAQENRNKKISC